MYSVVLLAALSAGEGSANWHRGYVPSWCGPNCNYGACYGACYGVGYNGWGGWGQPYGGYGWPGYACWGGCGGYASAAYGVPMTPLIAPSPSAPGVDPSVDKDKSKDKSKDKDADDEDDREMKKDKDKGKDKSKDKDKDKDKDEDADQDENTKISARVIFVLPEGARLHVDDRFIEAASGLSTFKTPRLEKGRRYFYDVRVEVTREGKPVTETRRLVVRPGSVLRADFTTIKPATTVVTATPR